MDKIKEEVRYDDDFEVVDDTIEELTNGKGDDTNE